MKNSTIVSNIKNAPVIGLFFLFVFPAYGFGRYYFETGSASSQYIGAFLILLNALMVLSIGVLFRETLAQYNLTVSNLYFLTRLFEAIATASILFSAPMQISNDLGYFLGMLILGIGSMPMCLLLLRYQIAPSWLALWGIIGYALLAFGFLMELLGFEWSMYLLGLGGLWEVTFGFWLILQKRQ